MTTVPFMRLIARFAILAALLSGPAAALASEGPPSADPASAEADSGSYFTMGGYVETYYQWNFNRPSNGITHLRGFDNRHNTFTVSNVALEASWEVERLFGNLTLQVGHTPSTYYAGEPSLPGASGANGTDAELWKYVQQANVGYRFDVGGGLTVSTGLFLSPIGPESIAVRDNWNWSRSNLFFGLPFYHTGVRVSYALSSAWEVTLAGYNGWNNVADNNSEKSLSLQLTYTSEDLDLSMLYFSGVERSEGAPEGRAWRHLFDTHALWRATHWLTFLAQANAGFEPNEFGTSLWAAGAISARFQLAGPLFLALRGDAFYEKVADNSAGRASAIFWSAPWVASATATVDFRPHDNISFRLEYRHDRAGGDVFFGATVDGDGVSDSFVENRPTQDTATLGVTAWF